MKIPRKDWSVTILSRVAGIGLVFLLPTFLMPAISPAADPVLGPLVNGFEGYSLGKLQDQNGWLWTGSTLDTATVENTVAYSGSQAVEVYRGGQSDTRWAVPLSVTPTSQQSIDINWEMKVLQANGGAPFGPFFGVEAYDGNAAGGPGLFGSLGVDATTGDVLYQAPGTGYLTETSINVGNNWNQYRLLLNFGTQQYSVYVNGSLLTTQGFVDSGLGLTTFTDADLSTLGAAADSLSQSATGTAYYDNFTVQLETHGVWKAPQSGSWSVGGNWQDGQVPVGGPMVFSGSSYWPLVVTLDGNQKAGSITFSVSGSNGYVLAPGSGGVLTLDNSGSVATINVTGPNAIAAPLSLASSLSVTTANEGQLQISGNIGEATPGQSLLVTGDGTGALILSGSDSYTGGTTVSMGGVLIVENSHALPTGTSLTVEAGGTLLLDSTYQSQSMEGTVNLAPVPEPSSLALLTAGGLLLWLIRYSKRRAGAACPR